LTPVFIFLYLVNRIETFNYSTENYYLNRNDGE
jgi:hypothetical protein